MLAETGMPGEKHSESGILMIQSKQDLKEYISADNDFLRPKGAKAVMVANYAGYPTQSIRRFLYYLRKQEYYINTAKGNKLKGIMGLYYERRKNRLGMKLGLEIGPNCFGKGLSIWHAGNIVVNAYARIGENCTLHGGNCIGNTGKDPAVPRIGNNVNIGFGAVIIGDIEIADDVVIGANAVVNGSIPEPGSVVVGVPGRIK